MIRILSRRALLWQAAALALPASPVRALSEGLMLPIGKSSFLYRETPPSPFAGVALPVYVYRPQAVDPKTTDRILFVMHGMLRNGADYRDQWVEQAEKYQALLIVPEFPSKDFPAGMYNRGNVRGKDDDLAIPPERWTFAIIERLFRYLTTTQQNPVSGYYLYGHSAGGQFVHRLIEFLPEAHVRRAVAANAGYYTLPDETAETYPFSRTGTPKFPQQAKQAIFAKELIILLGERDTDPNDPDLYHSPEADQQGLHRFARGQNFIRVAREVAKREHLNLRWHSETVPEVGHDNTRMAPAAARLLFGAL